MFALLIISTLVGLALSIGCHMASGHYQTRAEGAAALEAAHGGSDLALLQSRGLDCREFQLRADTVNETERTVDAIIATENPVQIFDSRTWEIIDERLIIEGGRFASQMPLLENHNRFDLDAHIGSVRNIRKETVDGTPVVVAQLHFTAGDERADRAFNKVKQRDLTDVSIGYRVSNFVDIPATKTQNVGGRDFTAGERTLRVTTAWQGKETSLTPIGADEGAKLREHGTRVRPANTNREQIMQQQLRAYLESIGLRGEVDDAAAWKFFNELKGSEKTRATGIKNGLITPAVDPAEPTRTPAAEATPTPTPTPAAAPAVEAERTPVDADQVRAAERTRIAEIRALAVDANGNADVDDALVQRAIDETWSPDQASRQFVADIRRSRTDSVGHQAASTTREQFGEECRAMSAALCSDLGEIYIDPRGDETARQAEARDAERGDRYRGMNLIDYAREALRLAGCHVPYGREAVLRELQERAASSSALTAIFGNIVTKVILTAYAEAADSTVGWTRNQDVPDFKTNDLIRFGKSTNLENLGEGGEAKHAVFDDSKEPAKLARFAKQWVIDQIALINDDTNALSAVPRAFGDAAARMRADLVYSVVLANANLTDGDALFSSAHANDAALALTEANLETVISKLSKQQQNGVNLNIPPRVLVTPQDLQFTARRLLNSAELTPTDAQAIRGNRNVLADLNMVPVSDNRIGVAGVIDPRDNTPRAGSATQWYISGEGANAEIVVQYRRGTGRRPVLQRWVQTMGSWGIGWAINLDIIAAPAGFRGIQRGNV